MSLMRKIFAASALVLAFASAAFAQNGPSRLPTVQNGYGTLSVSNSSIAVSGVTTSPNSAAFPMPGNPLFGNLVIENSPTSAGLLYVCALGGTCSSSNGWPLPAGSTITLNLGGQLTSPTVIAATTATALVGW